LRLNASLPIGKVAAPSGPAAETGFLALPKFVLSSGMILIRLISVH
jgi:hypothetical protein